MNRSGHVLVMWWALFIIMQRVLIVLCDLSSSTSPAAPVTPSVLSYVQWCMLWSSLLAFTTHISRGAPLDEPSQHHVGKSVTVALSGWLPWRWFRDARRATTVQVRHVDAAPLRVTPVPVRTGGGARAAPGRHGAACTCISTVILMLLATLLASVLMMPVLRKVGMRKQSVVRCQPLATARPLLNNWSATAQPPLRSRSLTNQPTNQPTNKYKYKYKSLSSG